MEYITTTLGNLVHQTAFFSLTWGNVVMIAVACVFLYLAIRHGFEPLLLVPIAFGMFWLTFIRTSCFMQKMRQMEQADCFTTSINWMSGQSSLP